MHVTKLFPAANDFHIVWKKKSMATSNCSDTNFHQKYLLLCFNKKKKKKKKQVWNNLRVSKWWQSSHFWVNYPISKMALIACQYEDFNKNAHISSKIKCDPGPQNQSQRGTIFGRDTTIWKSGIWGCKKNLKIEKNKSPLKVVQI